MELLPGIEPDGAAAYLPASKTLVLADLHIGYEEEKRNRGVLLPAAQRRLFIDEIERLLGRHDVERIVLAGDVKHEFGRISQQEWSGVLGFLRRLQEHASVEVIAGNHDTLLAPILEKESIPLVRSLLLGDILIVHGDATLTELVEEGGLKKEELAAARTIIMGHEHPALRLTDGVRTETVKCFLVGKTRSGRKRVPLVVLPSFNPLSYGTDVLRERPLGPLLRAFGDFSAFALVDGKVLAFGLVEALQRRERDFIR